MFTLSTDNLKDESEMSARGERGEELAQKWSQNWKKCCRSMALWKGNKTQCKLNIHLQFMNVV